MRSSSTCSTSRLGVHLVAHLDGVAVDLHAALGNDLFCRTAGAQTLFSHDLLNTFFCHNKTPCAPPGAQNAHLSPVLGCGCACIKTVSWKLTVTAIVVSRPAGSFLREQRRVAAPSSRFAIACVLLAAAPTATPCFRRWRRSLPLAGLQLPAHAARRAPPPGHSLEKLPAVLPGSAPDTPARCAKPCLKCRLRLKSTEKPAGKCEGYTTLVVWRAQAGRSVRCQAPSLTAQQEQQALPSFRPS